MNFFCLILFFAFLIFFGSYNFTLRMIGPYSIFIIFYHFICNYLKKVIFIYRIQNRCPYMKFWIKIILSSWRFIRIRQIALTPLEFSFFRLFYVFILILNIKSLLFFFVLFLLVLFRSCFHLTLNSIEKIFSFWNIIDNHFGYFVMN